MKTKICLYGPTGSGKTTIAQHLIRKYNAELIKIATPLYQMQNEFYQKLGKTISGQDGEFLQFLASKILKENPFWLTDQFLKKVSQSNKHLIVNDDCRLNSYDVLKKDGFIFIRVSTSSKNILKRMRNDHTPIDTNHPVEQGFDKFNADHIIENNGSIDESLAKIDMLVENYVRPAVDEKSDYGWLTGSKIMEEVKERRIIIEPFNENCLNPNSYNYHLSATLRRISSEIIDCKKTDEYEEINIPEQGYILLPGECYLGATHEVFGSNFYASLITGRSSVGRKFLTNHVTAGLIDQGFFGNITLEITAQKKTKVYPGMVFGQIFWFTTFGFPYLYEGKYQGQNGPTCSRLHKDTCNKE